MAALRSLSGLEFEWWRERSQALEERRITLMFYFTPVAGLIFETKNREIFLERFFWREITGREQVSRAVILEKF